jgi:hypothetical protein
MNNCAVFEKFVIIIITTTMLSAIMLAVSSSSPSLVPAQAFAQEEEGSIEGLLGQVHADSNNPESTRENEEGDNSVIADPIVQTSVQPAVNVDVDLDVITDKENCEEASDNVNQRNDLSSSQGGDGSTHVNPLVQTSTQFALNLYVDTDVILAEDCIPTDNVNQRNDLSSSQVTGSNGEGGDGSTINIPTYQREDAIARNEYVERTVIIPLSLLQ